MVNIGGGIMGGGAGPYGGRGFSEDTTEIRERQQDPRLANQRGQPDDVLLRHSLLGGGLLRGLQLGRYAGSCSVSRRSFKVIAEFSRTVARIRSRCSANFGFGPAWPPRGCSVPVSRRNTFQ